jgi:hypothetical protein
MSPHDPPNPVFRAGAACVVNQLLSLCVFGLAFTTTTVPFGPSSSLSVVLCCPQIKVRPPPGFGVNNSMEVVVAAQSTALTPSLDNVTLLYDPPEVTRPVEPSPYNALGQFVLLKGVNFGTHNRATGLDPNVTVSGSLRGTSLWGPGCGVIGKTGVGGGWGLDCVLCLFLCLCSTVSFLSQTRIHVFLSLTRIRIFLSLSHTHIHLIVLVLRSTPLRLW